MESIDTPALIVDLDKLDHNLETMAHIAATHQRTLCPHATAHLSPRLSVTQCQKGASAVSCHTVSEAQALYLGGVSEIIITQPVWGQKKWLVLASLLAQGAGLTVICASHDHAHVLADLAGKSGKTLGVMLRVPAGLERGGSFSDVEWIDLANVVQGLNFLHFRGICLPKLVSTEMKSYADRKRVVQFYAELVKYLTAELSRASLECRHIACGETAGLDAYLETGLGTILQCGAYALMDSSHVDILSGGNQASAGFQQALMILTTATERLGEDKLRLDGGRRAIDHDIGVPRIPSSTEMNLQTEQDHYGGISVSGSNLELGDRLLILPTRTSQTVHLHDWFVGIRGLVHGQPVVEAVWPLTLRSCQR